MERTAVTFERMTAKQRGQYAEVLQTLSLLASLCEGHNPRMQDFLREQPRRPVRTAFLHPGSGFVACGLRCVCGTAGGVCMSGRGREARLWLVAVAGRSCWQQSPCALCPVPSPSALTCVRSSVVPPPQPPFFCPSAPCNPL